MGNAIKKDVIHAEGIDIGIYTSDYENEFISLTDIAKKKEGEYPGYVIQNWMRNRSVISFIGLWEALHNPNFNCLEFEAIKNEAPRQFFQVFQSVKCANPVLSRQEFPLNNYAQP